MDDADRLDSRPGTRRRRVAPLLLTAFLALLGLGVAWASWRTSGTADGLRSLLAPLTGFPGSRGLADILARSPYKNVRPGVEYVGDAACSRCHSEIAETYRQHPMGRSLAPIDEAVMAGGGSPSIASFLAQGFEYSVERRGDRVFHKETRKDAKGNLLAEVEAEARYVIGSGGQAQAFVLDRAGYLFESPITWYAEGRRWDLSPGYEGDNLHFERFVKPACLFCHSNRFDHVEGTENRYREPIFRGHAIGCERCHGPGELHVKWPETRDGEAPNIVNPSHLESSLREAVCQQCHLQGDIRVVREGRSLDEFRPGLPLDRFESVFVKSAKVGKTRFFGQVEQMHESRCFRESRGEMGCISCHDPHKLPPPEEKVAYYRGRCLECHDKKGCSLSGEERLARSRDDSCIECHMPRSPNAQVPHTATTLHLIPRFADREDSTTDPLPRAGGDGFPLVHFHRDLLPPGERAEVARDLGIALTLKSRAIPGMSAAGVSRMALPLLEASLAARPDDVPAWGAKGSALWNLHRREESLAAYQAALAKSPDREEAIVAVATRAAQSGRRKEALAYWRRAIEINPWRADYHQALGLEYARNQDWRSAIEESRKALRLNPSNVEGRMFHVQCLLKSGRVREARDEFAIVLDFNPPGRENLERWFAKNQPR